MSSVIAVVAAVAVVAGCTSTASGGKKGAGGLEQVSTGTLKTCTHLPYAPFQVKKNGKIVQGREVNDHGAAVKAVVEAIA
ncbi:hypothetical protein ACFY0Z_26775 [Streptomyces kronopolitis]|uniref:hypothetical protein n=1 Tax=Streptomyces kronopolitis TaxID=1612435 RepID=UPI0036C34F87